MAASRPVSRRASVGGRRRSVRSRSGVTLLELLVALPIATMLLATTTVLLLLALRSVATQLDLMATRLETRRAAMLLADAWAPLRWRELRHVSDTLLEADAHVSVGTICAAEANGLLRVGWSSVGRGDQEPRVGDEVELWTVGDVPAAPPEPMLRAVRALRGAPGPTAVGTPCPSGTTGAQSWVTVDSIPVVLPGSPVLVRRRTRWVHYRSGDDWWIGQRRWSGRVWDPPQPIAGPMASARETGVAIRAWRRPSGGHPSADPAVMLEVMVRQHLPGAAMATGLTLLPLWDAIADPAIGFSINAPRAMPTGSSPP